MADQNDAICVGIDLGTTFSTISFFDTNTGKPELIKDLTEDLKEILHTINAVKPVYSLKDFNLTEIPLSLICYLTQCPSGVMEVCAFHLLFISLSLFHTREL